jgi:hypothetical protein
MMFFGQSIFSQTKNDFVYQLGQSFNTFSKNIVSDNVYLQTSKDIYETEEDVWFKGYVLDAKTFSPSLKNKTLYVQLTSADKKKVFWEEKYEIEKGFVDGHLFLQDSLKSGKYLLSAYSQHSYFKSQKEFYAFKQITIVKKIQEKVRAEIVKNDSVAQFTLFPEGGHLVANIENTIAFKGINKQGLPLKVSGTVFENNLPILDFKSKHDGMGSFALKPNPEKQYYIKLQNIGDKKHPFPEIKKYGKTLHLLTNSDDFLRFRISQSKELENTTVYLRVQLRGTMYSFASIKLKEHAIIKIPLKEIPQGIAEVTLFDKNKQPIAERLVYLKPNKNLNIKTTLSRTRYKTREKATLKIRVTDKNNNPVVVHLGLSIFDEIYQASNTSKNILSHYYLSTQIKGAIYNPTYYFNKKNSNRLEALNLLVLTQGWRCYIWNETNLKDKLEHIVFDTIDAEISTQSRKKPKTITPLFVSMFSRDKQKSGQIIQLDSTKHFSILPLHFKMAEKSFLYLRPFVPEKPKYTVSILDSNFININKSILEKTLSYPITEKREVEIKVKPFYITDKVRQLDEIKIITKGRTVFRDKYLGELDSLAKAELVTDYVCMHPGHAVGVGILNCFTHGTTGTYNIKPIEGKKYMVLFGENGEDLDENHSSKYFFGQEVRIYNYRELTEEYLLEHFNLKMIKGYYGKREFYNPVYDEVSINDSFPDYRNTLFWKPDIITDTNGEASISFFCSDINSNFIGIIEGVTNNGLLGANSIKFNVTKR